MIGWAHLCRDWCGDARNKLRVLRVPSLKLWDICIQWTTSLPPCTVRTKSLCSLTCKTQITWSDLPTDTESTVHRAYILEDESINFSHANPCAVGVCVKECGRMGCVECVGTQHRCYIWSSGWTMWTSGVGVRGRLSTHVSASASGFCHPSTSILSIYMHVYIHTLRSGRCVKAVTNVPLSPKPWLRHWDFNLTP